MVEKRTIVEQPTQFAGANGSAAGTHPASRHLLRLLIAAAVLLIFVLGIVTGYLEKWLWMRQLNYTGVFWTLLSVQWAMFCSAFVFAFLYLWLNLRQAVRNSAAFREDGRAGRPANCVRSRCARAGRYRFFSQALETGRRPGQCRRRLVLCAWFLRPMGYLPPLSLRRVLRSARSALRGRRRVLPLSSALLWAVANQSNVADGVGARGRRSDLRVLWITCGSPAAERSWHMAWPLHICPCFFLFW